MKSAAFFKGKLVKDQFGTAVTVLNVTGNSVQVLETTDSYHTTMLYYKGKSLFIHLAA